MTEKGSGMKDYDPDEEEDVTVQMRLEGAAEGTRAPANLVMDRVRFSEVLEEAESSDRLVTLRNVIRRLRAIIESPKSDRETIIRERPDAEGCTVIVRRDILLSELDQILEARTIERAKYYVRRLRAGILGTKTNHINEINLLRWKEYDDIITDSLWILPRRDTSGAHLAWYWGNFIPQIPRQMMLRYTRTGDWVLDTFVGSGTTLIECRRLGRNGIGIELNPEVAERARELVESEPNEHGVVSDIVVGDSRTIDIAEMLKRYGIDSVQLVIMHPPYHDIIKFTEDDRDLSNAPTVDEFLKMFGEVVDNVTPYLEKGRYLVLVIGDKYTKGEWIPLGFYCMQEVMDRDYLLKSIIVKNFEETRGKRAQKELWRYRALAGGFYVFKHEYIMLFVKK